MDIDRVCTDVGESDRHQMSVNSKLGTGMSPASLLGTILGCAIFALFTWPVGDGFMVALAVPFLAFWLPYSAFIMWLKPVRRRLQAVKVCLWLAVVAGSCCLHWYYWTTARADAEEVIRTVLAYKERTGSYPERPQDAELALGGPWHIGYITYAVGARDIHAVIYVDTFRPFGVHRYEFEARRWFYQPG